MEGQILQVEPGQRSGLILGADGNRYGFSSPDWKPSDAPATGLRVDFVATDGRATEIFALPGQANAPPAPAAMSQPAGMVNEGSSVMLGLIGIGCLLLGFVIPVLPTVVAFILGLVGADSAKRHNNNTGLILSRVAWIGALILMAIGVLLLVFAASFAWPFLQMLLDNLMEMARQQPTHVALL